MNMGVEDGEHLLQIVRRICHVLILNEYDSIWRFHEKYNFWLVNNQLPPFNNTFTIYIYVYSWNIDENGVKRHKSKPSL